MSEILDVTGKPAGFTRFKKRLTELLGGAEPKDEREELITGAIQLAKETASVSVGPITQIMTVWFLWMSITNWVKDMLTPAGVKATREVDSLLAGLSTTLLYDMWRSLANVPHVNGEGEGAKEDGKEAGTDLGGDPTESRPVQDS